MMARSFAPGSAGSACPAMIRRGREDGRMEKMCHCGQPLHYSSPAVQAAVEKLIEAAGGDEYVTVTVEGRSWRIQRHYIALHGIKAEELPRLGFDEITPALK